MYGERSYQIIIGFMAFFCAIYFLPYLLGNLQLLWDAIDAWPRYAAGSLVYALILVVVGLIVSLLASFLAWPFSLSILTVCEYNRKSPWVKWGFAVLQYWAKLPLLFYVFLFFQVLGPKFYSSFKTYWIDWFVTPNIFTEAVAFAMTLLLFPLTILPFFGEDLTINSFFNKMLSAVIEFGEVGLVTSVLVIGFWLYLLPKMTLQMYRQLYHHKPYQSYDVVQSLGGSVWESLHLSVLQLMKNSRWALLLQQARHCFFEGLIAYSLIVFLSGSRLSESTLWQGTVSAYFVEASIFDPLDRSGFSLVVLLMTAVFILFYFLEEKLKLKEVIEYDS